MNQYTSLAQLNLLYDLRSLQMLGNDENQRLENLVIIQNALDVGASYVDQHLNGRLAYDLTQPMPMILTGYVADRAVSILYGRRGTVPKDIQAKIAAQDATLQKLAEGTLSLAAFGRSVQPALVASESLKGVSRFDDIPNFDQPASPTAPGGYQSNLHP
jgi:phage gp36-like protein